MAKPAGIADGAAVAGLTPTSEVLVGRQGELAAVEDFLEALLSGPAGLLVSGEPGIGKTTLFSAAVLAARHRSYHVLRAGCVEPEAGLSFSALGDLLDAVGDDLIASLPQVQQASLHAALLRGGGPVPADQRTICVALLGLLRLLAESAPVVVAVDDAEWLDSPSARVLAFAARRLSGEPVGLCWTTSDSVGGPGEFGELLPGNGVRRIKLRPLSQKAIDRVLTIHAGRRLPRPVVSRIHQACRGNPFYAVELARGLSQSPQPLQPSEPFPIPEDLSDMLHARLRRAPAGAGEVLAAAAALSRPTVALLSGALGQKATRPLWAAAQTGLVQIEGDDVRFAHPLLATAALSLVDPPARKKLHRRLARAAQDPEERARQLLAASSGPDASLAAALDAGADAALARGAPEAAGELREQASRFTPAGSRQKARERALLAAEHFLAAGEIERATALCREWLEKTRPGPVRAGIYEVLARASLLGDSFRGAAEWLAKALPEAEPDSAQLALVHLESGFVSAQVGDLVAAADHGASALKAATRAGSPALIAQALAGSNTMNFVLGRRISERKLHKAMALELTLPPAQLLISPSLLTALFYMWLGRLNEARELFAVLFKMVGDLGYESTLPFVAGLWGGAVQAECWAGDLETASRYAYISLETASRLEGTVPRGIALSALSCVLAYRGEPESTRKAAEEASDILEQAGMSGLCMWPLGMAGLAELSRGDPAAAAQTLGAIAEMIPGAGVGEPAALPFVPDAIEALAGSGDLDRAGKLAEWLGSRADALGRPWTKAMAARCRGLVLAAEGDLQAAGPAFEESVAHFEQLPMPIEHARTLLAQGALLRRTKQKRAAKQALERALRTFEKAGALLWSERAREELTRIGLRPAAPLGLTPTEQQVAKLAAAGRRTREIAGELFMSPKTVESVMTRIHRKLGTRSRAEVATLVAEGRIFT